MYCFNNKILFSKKPIGTRALIIFHIFQELRASCSIIGPSILFFSSSVRFLLLMLYNKLDKRDHGETSQVYRNITSSVKFESHHSDFLSSIKEVIQDELLSLFVSFSLNIIDFVFVFCFYNVCEPTQLKGSSLLFLMFGVN